ncbi:MAG: undecaprenyl/decaprenyl-phosphate alpha-N-acetylglucosaminyl 1-phosphate transferase [Spirochaetaceae bacterium]|jgi:UDP-GlcNAc:undecaprenyl-phosphate GlcNAc-1-phosphate transferase|nr:undecaprenyl/decaprenyl-phosphate alpha-N-acetylglucosaminyl 1-phosphate transferase [Spirochaetaceae bacterium]
MSLTLFISLIAFALSFCLTGLTLIVAKKKRWFDFHDSRKVHQGNVPRLGGIGFCLTFFIMIIVIELVSPNTLVGSRLLPVCIGGLSCFLIGIRDDFKSIPSRYRLIVQCFAGVLVSLAGYGFNRMFFFDLSITRMIDNLALLNFFNNIQWLWSVITIFWVVGIINAVNFIDGVDGLSAGFACFASAGYMLFFHYNPGFGSSSILCAVLIASLLGFLVFNWPFPHAKIFMGDGGAYFLGFILATLPLINDNDIIGDLDIASIMAQFDIDGSFINPFKSNIPLFYAAAFMLIPIMDTTFATFWRMHHHIKIDTPDRIHIHHKLMNLKVPALGIDAFIYSLEIIVSLLAVYSSTQSTLPSLFYLFSAYLIVLVFFLVVSRLNSKHEKTLF